MLKGELAGWEETPEGSLAKLLLLGPIGEVKATAFCAITVCYTAQFEIAVAMCTILQYMPAQYATSV
jgi:hypothetical protein